MEKQDKGEISLPTATPQTVAPQTNLENLYLVMGQLGMQAEQKQFEQDLTALQSSLSAKGESILNEYGALRKKSTIIGTLSTAVGALVGSLTGFFLAGKRPNWGFIKKGAATVGGGFVGAGISNVVAGMPARREAAKLQQQASEIEAMQAGALAKVIDKYTTLVEQRKGTAPAIVKGDVPEEPQEPTLPDALTQEKAEMQGKTQQSKTALPVPSTLLEQATASPLVSPNKAASV